MTRDTARTATFVADFGGTTIKLGVVRDGHVLVSDRLEAQGKRRAG